MERNTAKRTLEKLLSVCICLCMLGAMLPAQVFAEEADTAQTETVQDTAPKDTVYLSSADDLIQLAKNCRLDSWSQNRTVVLEADINLSSVDFNGIPSFGGTWEGQNHAITGLSLSQDGSVQGLFRYVQQGALVRDMTVKGRIKPGGTRASVGGIAGSNTGTLHNCRFEGVSSGASVVGGIAGTNLAAGVIESCTTTGSVYGAHFIGGIAGENHGIIANCTNTSSVNTTVEQNDIDLSSLTLNDLIGGLTITFDDDYTEIHSTFTKGSTVTLNRWYMDKFITYRSETDLEGAYKRGMRSMAVMKALFNQCKGKIVADPAVALEYYNGLKDYITTDLDLTEITYLARNMGKMYFTSDTIVRLPGETVMGERYAEFYPDESWLHDFVVEKFCVPAE